MKSQTEGSTESEKRCKSEISASPFFCDRKWGILRVPPIKGLGSGLLQWWVGGCNKQLNRWVKPTHPPLKPKSQWIWDEVVATTTRYSRSTNKLNMQSLKCNWNMFTRQETSRQQFQFENKKGFIWNKRCAHAHRETHARNPKHRRAQQYASLCAKWHIATIKGVTLFLKDKAVSTS